MEQLRGYEIGHKTFVFERHCEASVKRVFAAFADPVIRAKWSAPSNDAAFIYDEADFREGGEDRFRCGSKENPQYTGCTKYISIVPDRLLVSSEIIEADGRKLMSSLITTEFEAGVDTTKIKLTVQAVSFFGERMLEGIDIGNNAALDNLVDYITDSLEF